MKSSVIRWGRCVTFGNGTCFHDHAMSALQLKSTGVILIEFEVIAFRMIGLFNIGLIE